MTQRQFGIAHGNLSEFQRVIEAIDPSVWLICVQYALFAARIRHVSNPDT